MHGCMQEFESAELLQLPAKLEVRMGACTCGSVRACVRARGCVRACGCACRCACLHAIPAHAGPPAGHHHTHIYNSTVTPHSRSPLHPPTQTLTLHVYNLAPLQLPLGLKLQGLFLSAINLRLEWAALCALVRCGMCACACVRACVGQARRGGLSLLQRPACCMPLAPARPPTHPGFSLVAPTHPVRSSLAPLRPRPPVNTRPSCVRSLPRHAQ